MSTLTEAEVAQALKHSLRRKLIPIFNSNRPLSPVEAAGILNAPLVDVAYHVGVLVKFGFLVLHEKEQVRGAIKNLYIPSDETLSQPTVKRLLAENPPT